MDPIINLLDTCIDYIKSSNLEGLFWIILLISCTWLFREFRKSNFDDYYLNNQKTDKAIELYSMALLSIKRYEIDNNNLQLYESLYALFPYSPKNIINSINDYIDNQTVELTELKQRLKYEIGRLKNSQNYDTTYEIGKIDGLFNSTSYFLIK